MKRSIISALLLIITTHVHADLQQKENALIEGQNWAIAYSGFRDGQHPDRGDGAINPSDAEILEDLKLLEKEGFRLIRMYDSGENTERILKLSETIICQLKCFWAFG